MILGSFTKYLKKIAELYLSKYLGRYNESIICNFFCQKSIKNIDKIEKEIEKKQKTVDQHTYVTESKGHL